MRGPGSSVFAAGFGLREYPASIWPGMFDAVLGAPYRCVLTQTFAPLGKQDAQDRMTRKQNQMVVAGDKAASQTAALAEAADLLQGNAFVMGDHHLTLVVFADSLPALSDVAAQARRDLAESGAVVAREVPLTIGEVLRLLSPADGSTYVMGQIEARRIAGSPTPRPR